VFQGKHHQTVVYFSVYLKQEAYFTFDYSAFKQLLLNVTSSKYIATRIDYIDPLALAVCEMSGTYFAVNGKMGINHYRAFALFQQGAFCKYE